MSLRADEYSKVLTEIQGKTVSSASINDEDDADTLVILRFTDSTVAIIRVSWIYDVDVKAAEVEENRND